MSDLGITNEEDLKRTIMAIQLSCEKFPDDILCPEGRDMKAEIIHNINFLGSNKPEGLDRIALDARTVSKAKLWDRAMQLADEGKMLKEMTEKIIKLEEKIANRTG